MRHLILIAALLFSGFTHGSPTSTVTCADGVKFVHESGDIWYLHMPGMEPQKLEHYTSGPNRYWRYPDDRLQYYRRAGVSRFIHYFNERQSAADENNMISAKWNFYNCKIKSGG